MASAKEEEDFYEEDIVFDQERLLISRTAKKKSAIQRVSSGKCITFAKTLGLCGTFFGLGLCVAIPDFTFLSPLPDLQKGTSLFTNLFTARSFGYIIGSLIAGFLFDRYNRLFLLFLSLLFTSVFITLTPWCYTLVLLELNMLVLGVSVGFLSTGGNVLCLDLWGRNSGPFMQALHFSFALGILVAPLLVIPVSTQSGLRELSGELISVRSDITNLNDVGRVKHESGNNVGENVNRTISQGRIKGELYKSYNFTSVFGSSIMAANTTELPISDTQSYAFSSPNTEPTLNSVSTLKITTEDISAAPTIQKPVYTGLPNKCDLFKTDLNNYDATCDPTSVVTKQYENTTTFKTSYVDEKHPFHNVTVYLNQSDNTSVTPAVVFKVHRFRPGTYDNDTEDVTSLFGLIAHKVEKYGFNRLQFTYLMVGLVIFLLSFLFFAFLCKNPRDPKSKQDEFRTKSKKISNICVQVFLVPLTAWFLFLCVGLQSTISQLIPLYALESPIGTSSVHLPTIFSASFTAMRFTSVFLSSAFRPSTLLSINIVTFTCGTIVLITLGLEIEQFLWIGCSLIGIGLASMVPTTILWIERYVHVSNKVTMVFVVSSTLGEMLLPSTIYKLMLSNYSALLYATVVINVLSVVTLISLWFLMGKHGQRFCATSHDGYHLANQNDEEDLLDMASILQPTNHHLYSPHNGLVLNGRLTLGHH